VYTEKRKRQRERKEAVRCPMQERESERINEQLSDEREIKERKNIHHSFNDGFSNSRI